jgi:hypothetical protein
VTARTAHARARVAVVTRQWGTQEDEAVVATRLVAGALARHAAVDVVHLVAPSEATGPVADSVFTVHRIPLRGARPLTGALVRTALGATGGQGLPAAAAALLEHYGGEAPDAADLLERLAPDAVVLAGSHHPYDLAVLGRRGEAGRPRVVALPLLGAVPPAPATGVRRVLERADAVALAHPGEGDVRAAACPAGCVGQLVPLDLAFAINRSATQSRLFGVRFFGRYVLLLRGFPPGGARFERSMTHEVLRRVVRGVSVAEVDGEHWRISDDENTLELPVNPSRVNLWRLMAFALFTIDVRPPGPVGREAIESMLLGTPVLVPEPSAAMQHAAAASGGLWYRDPGELFDAARALMSRPLRARLGTQGREYAEAHHGRMDDFVERVRRLVLGPAERLA